MRLGAVVAIALGLSGCLTAEEQAAQTATRDDAVCQSYGAKPGSDAYVLCRSGRQHDRVSIEAAQISAAPFVVAPVYTPPPLPVFPVMPMYATPGFTPRL